MRMWMRGAEHVRAREEQEAHENDGGEVETIGWITGEAEI